MKRIITFIVIFFVGLTITHAQVACGTAGYSNPFAAANGFNVFAKQGVTFMSGNSDGTIAMGGNATLNGSFITAMANSGSYPNSFNNTNNYGLVIGGSIVYTAGSSIQVNNGFLNLGNTTGSRLFYVDCNNAASNFRVTKNTGAACLTDYQSTPRIDLQRQQTSPTATNPSGLDFATAFTTLSSESVNMSNYTASSSCSASLNILSVGSGNYTLSLASNKVNVLNLTGTQLNAITQFTFNNEPTATQPLVINVNQTGSFSWTAPNFSAISNAAGRYVIFNFYNNTGTVTLTGSNTIVGSVLIPNGSFIKNHVANIEGQVVAQNITLNGGEVHYQPFSACLVGCSTGTPGCTGNLLVNGNSYYGGFEAGANNFSTGFGSTDLSFGMPPNGTYEVVSNANLSGGGGYLSLTPNSGSYLMNIHTSSNANNRLWYKTVSVTPGTTYTFSAWIANTKANPSAGFTVNLTINGTSIASKTAVAGWSQISGTYTVPAGVTSIEVAIKDPCPTSGGASHFLGLDDICFAPSAVTFSIGDFVWYDRNNNGVQDNDEPGLSGITVKLYADANNDNIPDGAALATTTTDANGFYSFNGRSAGGYIVGVTLPSGYAAAATTTTSTDPNNATDTDNNGVTLSGSEIRSRNIALTASNPRVDFGLRGTATIGDYVWNDLNKDGKQNSNESGLSGVTVSLVYTNGDTLTTVTDATGKYTFTNLIPGTYKVIFTTPYGNSASLSNQGTDDTIDSDPVNGVVTVTLTAGQTNNTIDAGFYYDANNLNLGNLVWNDINGNGIKDTNEPGVAGATVNLYKDDNQDDVPDGAAIATTTTNASGIYSFSNLAAGYYIVGVVLPNNYIAGANIATSDDPDSDVDNDNNGVNTVNNNTEVQSNNIYLSSGTEPSTDGDGTNGNLTLDFGLIFQANTDGWDGQKCYESPTKPTIVNATQTWRNNGDGTITLRTTLSKTFVDNTYGTGAIGWSNGHTFSNLTGSDQITVALYDAAGTKKLEFKQDYISANSSVPSGYKSLGVLGGDGGMLVGSSANILTWKTSMDANFNDFGYILTTSSPTTDAAYTPNATYPNWIYDVWYEVTFSESAFGTAGFGYPLITSVHASPSKTGSNTEAISPTQCDNLRLGNLVWIDANNNGIKDANESGAAGVTVKLYADSNGDNTPDGAAIATAITDGNGNYVFNGLSANKYIVGIILPNGYTTATTTSTSAFPNGNTDNDNNGISLVGSEVRSNFITLSVHGEPTTDGDDDNGNLTLDFAIKFNGSIGDFVWEDRNGNGLQDANEPGIAGVTVTLNSSFGTQVTTTDVNGFYSFNNLATGTYTVTFTTPAGYIPTLSNQGSNDNIDSDPVNGVVTVSYTAGTSNNTIDAGFYKPVQLGNLVWYDANNNGIKDASETGLAGLTVRLYLDANNDNVVDGAAIATTTTNASGNYLFSNLAPGNYIVGVVAPTGYTKAVNTATSNDPDNDIDNDNNGINIVGSEIRTNNMYVLNSTEPTNDGDGSDGNLTLDLGLTNPADFGPYDGSKCYQSATKPSIVNATQYWRNNGDGTITIRTTLAKTFVDNTYGTSAIGWSGGHKFSDLTGSDQLTLALYDASGVKKLEFKQDYITASTAAVSGYKSLGVSGGDGGMLLGSASSIVGARTSLDVNFNDYGYVLTTNSPVTTTAYAANATYPNWIYDVWYEITVSASAFGTAGFGYPLITSNHASPSKTGSNTENVVPVNCNSLTLGNLVWIDVNNNGIKDASELGLAGAAVKLYLDNNGDNIPDGVALSTTNTDANGNYLFTNLGVGKYIVGVVLPTGYTQATTTTTSSNPDNNTDNDNNGVTLTAGEIRTNFITLSTFAEPTTDGDDANGNLTLDIAIKFNGSIGDFVFEDENGNGIQEEGEAGIAGVTVTLNSSFGTQTTTTDANGFYSFSGLATGTYTVTFSTPAGYVASPANQGTNDNIDSDPVNGVVTVSYTAGTNNNTIDAGFYKPVSIGNLVWYDRNNNGIKDAQEPGLAGFTVKLYLDANNDNVADGAAVATTTTDMNGNYIFNNIAPGNYIVGVTLMNGFIRSYLPGTANDPDNDIDNDNNGINLVSGEVRSNSMLLVGGAEPTNDGDDNYGNMTLDFGLKNPNDFGDYDGQKCYESPTKPTIVSANQFWRNNGDGTITIRTTLSKTFVDNTYGTSKIGWPGSHNFSDLVGSDQLTMALYDANGTKKLEFKQDYITASSTFPSGYGTLGVSGGDGKMITGSASYILGAETSIDVNFNDYGYVLTSNSPVTTTSYAPNATYPNWIYDVWYEVTVSTAAFGTAGFGYPVITGTHASPSKTGSNTEVVSPVTCKVLNLGNQVWYDLNNNGAKDASEPGLNGLTVKLYTDNNNDNIADGGAIATTVTSRNGFYGFNNLAPGKYIVGVVLPNGYIATATTGTSNNPDNDNDNDNNGVNTVSGELRSNGITLAVGAEPTNDGDGNNGNLSLDFGLRGTASIGDFVWEDLNANGIQDAGEPGINGATVTLTGPFGTLTTTTNSSGAYSFTGLFPGTYSVTFTTPSGYSATPSNSGTNDAVDSDPVSGVVSGIVLTAGQTDNTIDAGFYRSLTLGDIVWYDLNNNGLKDASEPGISGVTVKLYADANGDNVPDGAAIATTVTNASGVYSFSNLLPGNYIVGVVLPNGYTSTITTTNSATPNSDVNNDNNGVTTVSGELRSNFITLTSGGEPDVAVDGDGTSSNLTLDFGLKGALNIGNLVWNDTNGNGIKNSFESGVAGVTVYLYQDANADNVPDGAAIATTTTATGGIYSFSNLSPGNYIVGILTPTGFAKSLTPTSGTNPNNNTDNDNNGIAEYSGIIRSNYITLTVGGEPDVAVDGDGTNGNLTLDFAIAKDTDGDKIPDVIDIDDDNDGITDLNESGGYDPLGDCDGDGIPNYLDSTPGCTTPSGNDPWGKPYQPLTWSDCNGDGINDFFDWDRDGIINELDLDSDNDGILDVQEARPNGVAVTSTLNGMITGTDADGNGLLSSYENGNPNPVLNGIAAQDFDRDGTPNFLDLDSDGDGITDLTEALGTYSTTGVVSGTDTDGDGVRAESFGSSAATTADNINGFGAKGITLLDSDNDGKPNAYDIDSDNDGITDNAEGQATCSNKLPSGNDCDGDGVDDVYDAGGCSSCLRTSGGITPFDKDGDGTPDYLDLDTDNDGALDIYEGHSIPSANGNVPPANYWIAQIGDADNDGLLDYFDGLNILTATGGEYWRNVINNNMGNNGGWDTGSGATGSITQLPKSQVSSDCSVGDRDWRNITILPASLVEFKGNLNNNVVNVTWTVTKEINLSHYEVERSTNGTVFTKVTSVQAANAGVATVSYNAADDISALTTATVYYRIKIVEKDGSFKHSNIISFKLGNKKAGIVVNPNPAISYFTLKITNSKEAVAAVKVIDMMGKALITQTNKVMAGVNTYTFNNLSNFSAGTYSVQVMIDNQLYTEKLIVVK